MNIMIRPTHIIFVMIALTMGVSLQASNSFLDTTVCELSENPNGHSQELVRVRAFILSDGMHGIALIDPTCDGKGVAFDFNDGADQRIKLVRDEDFGRLEALYDRILELNKTRNRIYGTFEGLFESHPDRKPTKVFVLQRVRDIHVAEHDDPKYALRDKNSK